MVDVVRSNRRRGTAAVEEALPDDLDAGSPGTTVTVTMWAGYRGTDAELIPMGSFMPVPEKLKSVATMFKEGLAG